MSAKPPKNISKGKKKEKVFKKTEEEKKEKVVEKTEEEKLAELEVEILWCIEQLHNGLSNPKKKSDAKQTQEAMKMIKTLKNPETPLVKKRLIMRNTFGDYRKKIAEEQKKFSAAAHKIKFQSQEIESAQKSQFFKKSETALSPQTAKSEELVKPEDIKDKETIVDPTETTNSEEIEDKIVEKLSLDSSEQQSNNDFIGATGSSSSVNNFYKMNTSDNSFRFNFDIS